MKLNFRRLLAMFLSIVMVAGMLPAAVFAEDGVETQSETYVAKIGETGYATFDKALAAASAFTGDVTVEIYDKVTLNEALSGSYSSITFVGNDTDAEIYLDVQGYITATGKKVVFENLILSKSAGGFITNAGFMNVAFGVYDVNEVKYTNCKFANGAYASSGVVTFTGCTFYRSHDKYGLWAYGNVECTVDDCIFADYRGIKMYAEGAAKTVVTVKDTDFSAVTDKPAIVLTYGESVTLSGNTYSETGVFELDLDGAPNGTAVTSTDVITAKNDTGACGVLVDGKIYTTVAQAAEVATSGSTVTLLHNSTEKVELAEGVTLYKNGFTADGVTVATPICVAQIGETTYTSLQSAVKAAQAGDTILLTADIDYGTDQLKLEKAITLDLGGKTLTTRNAWGGMSVKNNPTIKNGTIVHASNTAAIKVWNATAFEDLVIDVQGKGDANKTIGGIVLQEGSTTHVGSIKNVTIKGVALTNGIETYNCGNATEPVIGSMENVTIDAKSVGLNISAPCGTATNCSIKGGTNGIEIWIKGTYSATLDLFDCEVVGGVFAHDEFSSNPSIVNNGTLKLTADAETTGVAEEDITLTIARAEKVEGILEKVMDNAQAKVNDTYYATLAEAVAEIGSGDVVIDLLADATLDITAWQNLPIGGDTTKTITINGNGKTLTFNHLDSDWNNVATNNNAKLILNDMTITNSGYNNGPWNRHDINFACNVELNSVNSDKALAFKAGAVLDNVTISDANTSDTYAIWIQPNGQTVTITNSTIDMLACSDGRGIKIDNQYRNEGQDDKVTLNVSNTSFKTEEKAAIMVKSVVGADIALTKVDISGVAADTVNAVWNDEETADCLDKIKVTGGTVKQEGATPVYVAQIEGGASFTSLQSAVKAAQAGDTVTVFEGTYPVPAMKAGITIVGKGNVLFEGTLSGTLENLTLKNLHIKGGNAQRWAYAKGDCVFENVTFEATSVYALHFDGITEGATLLYKDCTIIGWAAMSGSPASCVFDGCTIKDNDSYGVIRTYFDATIQNCTFDVDGANTTDVYQDGIHAVGGAEVTVNNCTNANGDMADIVNVSGTSVITVDGVEYRNVAKIGNTYYKTFAEALDAVQNGETIVLIANVSEDVSVAKSLTIDGGNFKYTGNISVSGTTTEAVVKNVNFENGTGYAVTTNRIKSITVENCTVTNYGFGFLYANKSTPTVVVKNVTVDGGNYGFHWVYGTTAILENVMMTNVKNGLYIQNYAGKTITLKNCNISSIDIWEKATAVQTFKFKGANIVANLTDSQYAKYVLGATDATLTAPEGLNVTTTVDGYEVKYAAGKYTVVEKATLEDVFAGTTVLYGNELALNFYIKRDVTFTDGTNYYAKVSHTYADGSINEFIIQKDSWSYSQSNQMFYITVDDIAAKEMNDTITIQIFEGESDNGTAISVVRTDSIQQYATRRLKASALSEKEKTCIVDMLYYGAAAQTHFKYDVDNLATKELTVEQKSYASADVTMENHKSDTVGVKHKGSTASFEDNILLNLYYNKDLIFDKVVVTYTDHYDQEHRFELTKENGDIVDSVNGTRVIVDSLVLADVNTMVKCDLYNGTTLIGSTIDSIGSYLARIIPKTTDADELMLYKKAANFTTSAYAYLHEN